LAAVKIGTIRFVYPAETSMAMRARLKTTNTVDAFGLFVKMIVTYATG